MLSFSTIWGSEIGPISDKTCTNEDSRQVICIPYQASVILASLLPERMRTSSRDGMLLQYQDALSTLGQEICDSRPSRAWSDDYRIEIGRDLLRAETIGSSGLEWCTADMRCIWERKRVIPWDMSAYMRRTWERKRDIWDDMNEPCSRCRLILTWTGRGRGHRAMTNKNAATIEMGSTKKRDEGLFRMYSVIVIIMCCCCCCLILFYYLWVVWSLVDCLVGARVGGECQQKGVCEPCILPAISLWAIEFRWDKNVSSSIRCRRAWSQQTIM